MGIIESLLTGIVESKPLYDNGFDEFLRAVMEAVGAFLIVAILV